MAEHANTSSSSAVMHLSVEVGCGQNQSVVQGDSWGLLGTLEEALFTSSLSPSTPTDYEHTRIGWQELGIRICHDF